MEEGTSVTTIHFSTIAKVPPGELERIPFGERLTCSVDDATKVSGLSRSMIYNKMKSGEIEWTKKPRPGEQARMTDEFSTTASAESAQRM
jgi:hypothetical protein